LIFSTIFVYNMFILNKMQGDIIIMYTLGC
jgi:hypothetical protein